MTGILFDQGLDTLERRFQALRDQAAGWPEVREALAAAFHEVSQAIAALRARRDTEMHPPEEIPRGQEAQGGPAGDRPSPLSPAGSPARCETMLSHVFHAIPDLFNVVDRNFNIRMSNWHRPGESVPEAARQGQPKCHQVFWDRDCPCEDCQIREVFATGQPQRVEKVRPSDGLAAEINAFPIRDDSGQVILVAEHVRDITARHRAEQALRESEERFRAICETAEDCIFIKDRALRYTQVNPAMARLFERPEADLLGKSDTELFGEEATSHIEAVDRRVLQGEVVTDVDTKPVDGIPRTFHVIKAPLRDQAGKIVGLCGIARDISDLKQAEAAIQEREATLRTLIEANPESLFLMDTRGVVLAASKVMAQRLGKSLEEVIGKDMYALFPFEVGKKRFEMFHRAIATGQPVRFDDVRGDFHFDIHITPVFDQDNQVAQVAVLGVDISARKRAEQALRESEERFRTVFEHAPDSYYMVDFQGNFLDVNRCSEETSGYNRQELIGKNFQALPFLDEGQNREMAALLSQARPGEIIGPVEYTMTSRDGRQVVMEAKGLPIQLKGDNVMLVIDRDVTARKQAEAALQESEARYRALFEASPDAITVMDREMNFIMANRRGLEIWGIDSLEQADFKKAIEYIAPEDRPRVMAAMQKLLDTGQTQTFETTMVKRDGARFPSLNSAALIRDAAGRPQAIFGIARDITALKQAEAELQESERRFRLMAETIQDVFWMGTPGLEKILYVSPAYEHITGRSREELYRSPKSALEAIHPEDRERIKTEIFEHEAQGRPWSHEYRIIKPDGAVRWVQERGFPVQDEQGRITLYTGITTDVTECKALEQQLLQAQKMEAVGRLAGGVAHDFNNLLMAITGYGELMRAKLHRGDPLYNHLENILQAGERAAALTQQLLTFSRQQVIRPQTVNLNQAVLDLEPMLRRLIGEHLDLEVATASGALAVKADPGQLTQIILNLVLNARDAMPQGGRLILTIAPVAVREGRNTRFGQAPPGAYATLSVRDTGVGMDEATQTHIFEPFFTTKEPGKGTGLGLSTVYGIVKQSGGYIELASAPGQGSAFTIYLPRLEAMAAPPPVKAHLEAKFRGPETLLLVEDEDVLRRLLAKFLRLYGYTVLEARHGGEALLTCERHQGPIHLMVTDVVMPQMSGRELADRLALLRPEMQVLFMSGYTEDAMVQHGVANLAVPFLQKPFKPLELTRRVHTLLHPAAPN